EQADTLLFMVDVRDGLTAADHEIVELLRRTQKPLFLVANKCDTAREHNEAYSFAAFSVGDVWPISALKGHGVGDLLDEVVATFPPSEAPLGEEEDAAPRIAIVGRQNVGKSTLVNTILGEKRMIAGPVPGTTRDSIDSRVIHDGRPYVIIDTAGLRRRGKIEPGVEKLTALRAGVSMERADVAVVLIDAAEGVTAQDAHIAGIAQEAGCAAILAVNKWDLVEKDNSTAGAWAKALRRDFKFLAYAPILFLSALTGQRVVRLFSLIDTVLAEYRREIPTAELNRWLERSLARRSPPSRRGQMLRIKYATQIGSRPPTFALFANAPEIVHFSYERYLVNQLRETFGFEGTPIKLRWRKKAEDRFKEEQ
ncbi:MAG: ribosome biogenesis GTPase Der, partial [Candidatus Sumerlaeota bacterium]|nr:ribosome biogenesis GTPase Der [Candidatus Sumerlaeota bacterium]